MKYIFLDCEMGSVDLEYSLLSVHIMATDGNFQKIDRLNLLVKPDDGKFVVNGEAMGVNRIDLYSHSLNALPYKESGTILFNWLKSLSDNGADKLIPVGHGAYGDIKFITKYLISRGSWEKFVSYRLLDTSSTCQFLKSCGMFPETVSGGLTSLAEYFNIPVNENNTHTAAYDVELTYQVFMALRKLLTPIIKAEAPDCQL